MHHSLVLLHHSGKLEIFLIFFLDFYLDYKEDKQQERNKGTQNKLIPLFSSSY